MHDCEAQVVSKQRTAEYNHFSYDCDNITWSIQTGIAFSTCLGCSISLHCNLPIQFS